MFAQTVPQTHRDARPMPWRRALLLALVLAATGPAHAQAMVDGEVRKVDKAKERITLKHGAIANLDLPPMQMVFRVRDAQMLEGLNTGDRVRFQADRVDGEYTVTRLQKTP